MPARRVMPGVPVTALARIQALRSATAYHGELREEAIAGAAINYLAAFAVANAADDYEHPEALREVITGAIDAAVHDPDYGMADDVARDRAAEQAPPFVIEEDCPSAAEAGGTCEGGYIVHPPTCRDAAAGESRRLHTACPIHGTVPGADLIDNPTTEES